MESVPGASASAPLPPPPTYESSSGPSASATSSRPSPWAFWKPSCSSCGLSEPRACNVVDCDKQCACASPDAVGGASVVVPLGVGYATQYSSTHLGANTQRRHRDDHAHTHAFKRTEYFQHNNKTCTAMCTLVPLVQWERHAHGGMAVLGCRSAVRARRSTDEDLCHVFTCAHRGHRTIMGETKKAAHA